MTRTVILVLGVMVMGPRSVASTPPRVVADPVAELAMPDRAPPRHPLVGRSATTTGHANHRHPDAMRAVGSDRP
jgi:hypothetical protein